MLFKVIINVDFQVETEQKHKLVQNNNLALK